jgi:hypothetical protein
MARESGNLIFASSMLQSADVAFASGASRKLQSLRETGEGAK